jgi:hypothetical protein
MHWTKEYERGKIGFNGVPNQATMSIAQMNLKRLQANPYTKQAFTPGTYNAGTFTPSTPQLTLTRYLEQNPCRNGWPRARLRYADGGSPWGTTRGL